MLLLLCGCHPRNAPSPAVDARAPATADRSVQGSPEYQAAAQAYAHHDFRQAATLIDALLAQPPYRQSPSDRDFLLYQRSLCRHALDPRLPVKPPAHAARRSPALLSKTSSAVPADCGPRALRLACEGMGVHARLEDLRREAGTTRMGTTLAGLARAAQAQGLKAAGVQMDLPALERLSRPAVAWIDADHYVAVLSVRGDQATIHDPNKPEEEVVPARQVLEHSGGIFLTLSR